MDVQRYLIHKKHRKKPSVNVRLPSLSKETNLSVKSLPSPIIQKNAEEKGILESYKFKTITDTYQLDAVFRNESPLNSPGLDLLSTSPLRAPSPLPPPSFDPRLFLASRKRRRPWDMQDQYAALQIQRCWRGYIDRKRLWTFGGAGTHLMARRIQRIARGFLARLLVLRKLTQKEDLAAQRIQALYHGWRGRNEARARRVARLDKAASLLQRNYRGRLGRLFYQQLRFAHRTAKAIVIQRSWRAMCGRELFREERWRQKEETRALQETAMLHYQGKLISQIFEDQSSSEEELLLALHTLMCETLEYRTAHKILDVAVRRFPDSLALQYSRAMCFFLCWDAWGRKNMPRHDLLDEATGILRRCWERDPQRCGYYDYKRYFHCGRRLHPKGPRNLMGLALSYLVQFGNFDNDLRQFHTRDAYRRAESLLGNAAMNNQETKFEVIYSNIRVFYAVFQSPRQERESRVRRYKLAIVTSPVEKAAGYEQAAWKVKVYRSEDKIIIGARVDPSSAVPEGMYIEDSRDIIVHEEEVENLFEIAAQEEKKKGKNIHVFRKRDTYNVVCEYLLWHLNPVSTYNTRMRRREYQLIIPPLQKLRDQEITRVLEIAAARLVKRVYHGFVARALWRRVVHQTVVRHGQTLRLQQERERRQKRRDLEYCSVSLINAQVRGMLWRIKLQRMQAAALTMQMTFRMYYARKVLAEQRRKALEGLQAEEVFRKGVIISGVPLMLSIKKCGWNYKFTGYDAGNNKTYYGYLYSDQLGLLLHATQQDTKFPIRPWQLDRVIGLLLSKMSLVESIGGVTKELKDLDRHKTLVVHVEKGQEAHGPSLVNRADETGYDRVASEIAEKRKKSTRRRR